jgi:hypothetical protein
LSCDDRCHCRCCSVIADVVVLSCLGILFCHLSCLVLC